MTERTGHPDELLAGYVDGDLAGDEREAVETHLAGCATCREEVALARRAVAALEALEPAPSPLGLGTPAILGARTTPRRGVLRPRWAAALAAAAVVVVAAAVGGRFLIQG
ncbi:MAG TPA: zf-HC2 domain-containing protein, partial [Actinomycetota bacterium]|nr:zf-HC2 domain-containing protein [Actinomycetota bacterium]